MFRDACREYEQVIQANHIDEKVARLVLKFILINTKRF